MAGSIFNIYDNGAGTQIAVGASGTLLVSTDSGVTWSIRNSGTGEDLYGVAYSVAWGSPAWAVVGTSGTVLTSSDTITWVPRTSFTTEDLYDVAYGGVFLAVGANGAFGLSDDLGVTWVGQSSGTTEDLLDISVDLGAYLIIGTNDTVITGDITALEFDILVEETVSLTSSFDSAGSFVHSVSESLTLVSEESWLHDALGAGTTLTQGGTNQFVFVTDSVTLLDPAQAPTGNYKEVVTETATFLEGAGAEHLKRVFGNLDWPMFTVDGVITPGEVLTGNLTWPLFEVSGTIKKANIAALTWPLFTVSGSINPDLTLSGNLTWPLFRVTGKIVIEGATGSPDYEVWVVNRETGAYSTYTAWPANSYGRFNGVDIIATPSGLFSLTGDEDSGSGIPVKIYWPPSDFGTSKQKRLGDIIVDRRGGGNFSVVTITDETQKRVYYQNLEGFPSGMYPKRIQPTRGLRAKIIQYGIESTEGGGLVINGADVAVIILSRKLR